ncbi:MAG: S8 family peptidase [Lachnospiraceae bacterium]|nr:S8 family peptidase [Lachnospiraceae bacterium]
MIEKEHFYQTLIMNRVRNQLGLYNIEETTDHEAEPVTVAVLDSGIDSRHPDLEGKVLAFQDFIANRNIPYDDYGHGTHVCGSIAGNGTISDGLYAGIMPDARLVIGKILDKHGDGNVEKMAAAMHWVMEIKDAYNIRVLNISIGTGKGYEKQEYNEIRDLLDEAWYQGIMIVCAAGNSGPAGGSISMLGMNRNIITVGCHEGQESYRFGRPCQIYSGRGEISDIYRKPDIVAPGTEIISCKAAPYRGRTKFDKYYCKKSGTSMATAIVSGCCALYFGNHPSESNEYCKRRLLQTARNLGEAWNKQGYGMVNPTAM